MDWGLGSYERIAEQLLPAAEVVVAAAAPESGERVVDLGCGNGNAALLAARRGAAVTGVDPAQRLLDLAAARAREAGVEASFLHGEAAEMPLADGAADLLLSVFGVIFAPDAEAAAAEMARVTAADGRIVLSAWIPEGAISEAAALSRRAAMDALGVPPGPPGFAWHDRDALAALLGPHGFEVGTETHPHAFAAGSAAEWFETEVGNHPLRVAGAAIVPPAVVEEISRRSLEIFEAANEDPGAFRVTSRYVVATARRNG